MVFAMILSMFFPLLLLACTAFAGEPWTAQELLPPAQLAARLAKSEKPLMIYVGPAYLWRVKHIPAALNAGMASREEGIAALKKILAGKSKDIEIIVYCGCCPMNVCPNIRPAIQTIKAEGFTKVRLLELPTRLDDDWVKKGYPAVGE
jgi:thiosulfate/3-mercaptopyruvate sulfurtransferase